jgi:hypothetical protein
MAWVPIRMWIEPSASPIKVASRARPLSRPVRMATLIGSPAS